MIDRPATADAASDGDELSRSPEPFDEAFASLAALAYRVAYRISGDRAMSEDIAQEALARAFVRWQRVAPYGAAFTARVASNLAISELRGRTPRRLDPVAPRQTTPAAGDDAGAALRDEIVAGLRRLPRRQREVVVLRYLADLSEAEVAGSLGCAPGTVKQHAHRGLAALRRTLSSTTPEDRL